MSPTCRPTIGKEKNRFTISFEKFKFLYGFRNFSTQGTTVFLRRIKKSTTPTGGRTSNARTPFFNLLIFIFVCI